MRRLLWFLLVAPCFAQIQGNLPDVVDSLPSGTIGSSSYQIAMPEGVSTGQLIDVCVVYDTVQQGNTSAFSVTDTLGNTYTTTTPALSPIAGQQVALYHAYTSSGSTGANTITVNGLTTGHWAMTFARFFGLTTTLDGSVQNNSSSSIGAQNISTTNTTSTNGSVLVSCLANDEYSGSVIGTGDSEYLVHSDQNIGNAAQIHQSMRHTTDKGSYTLTDRGITTSAFGSNGSLVKQTIAFTPTATTITDTVYPDGANGVAYSTGIHGVGGTAAYTCSISSGSLPTSLSLGGTGNCTISGTPSANGTFTFTTHIDDGAGHTATSGSQTIKILATFNTPSVQEVRHANDELFGGSDNVTFSNSVLCGQVIEISFYGDDTHGINGWIPATSGTLNNITDSLGTVFTRIGPIGGSRNAPQIKWIGQATKSGIDTVHISNSPLGSGLFWTARLWNNVQPVVDRGQFTTIGFGFSSPQNFNTSYTTLVPNTVVSAATNTSKDNTGNSDSISYSPMSVAVFDQGITAAAATGSDPVASPSTYTLTTTINAANSSVSNPISSLFGLRPSGTYSGACSAALVGLNEPRRRQIF